VVEHAYSDGPREAVVSEAAVGQNKCIRERGMNVQCACGTRYRIEARRHILRSYCVATAAGLAQGYSGLTPIHTEPWAEDRLASHMEKVELEEEQKEKAPKITPSTATSPSSPPCSPENFANS
jgi:hypothetical protein